MSGIFRSERPPVAIVFALFCLANLCSATAHAHTRRTSTSIWRWTENRATASFEFEERNIAEVLLGPGLEAGAIGPRERDRIAEIPLKLLERNLIVKQSLAKCGIEANERPARRVGRSLLVSLDIVCPRAIADQGVDIELDLMRGTGLDHLHVMQVIHGDERVEIAFGYSKRSFHYAGSRRPEGTSTPFDAVLSMITQGVIHVLGGFDHVAFIATLVLAAWFSKNAPSQRKTAVLAAALAFTIGHSISLALAVTDQVRVDSRSVEVLIALSVAGLAWDALIHSATSRKILFAFAAAFVGVLCILIQTRSAYASLLGLLGMSLFFLVHAKKSRRESVQHAAVALGFGVVHGFGLGGALSDLGLEREHLARALISFNVGVEVGQLLIIGVLFASLAMLRRVEALLCWPRASGLVFNCGCAICLWAGLYWTVARALE